MTPLCEAEGIGMIPWSPLARGILARASISSETTERSESDRLLDLFRFPHDNEVTAQVSRIAKQRELKPAQVALAWLLSKPVITAPIVGASKLSHIDDAATAVGVRLTTEEVEILEGYYHPKPHAGITPPYHPPKPGAVHDRG